MAKATDREIHLREGVYVFPYRITNLPIERTRKPPYPVREMVQQGVWEQQTQALLVCHHCFQPFAALGQKRVYKDHIISCTPRGKVVYHDPKTTLTVRDYSTLQHTGEADVCSNLASLIGTFVRDKISYTDMAPLCMFALYSREPRPRSMVSNPPPEGVLVSPNVPADVTVYDNVLVGAFSHQAMPVPGSACHPNAISCFAVLPPYRQRGFGTFMVEFARSIATRGDPLHLRPFSVERPLSMRGRNSHRKVWRRECCRAVTALQKRTRRGRSTFTLAQVAREARMAEEDVVSTLRSYRILSKGESGGGPVLWMGESVKEGCASEGLFNAKAVLDSYQPVVRIHMRSPSRGD